MNMQSKGENKLDDFFRNKLDAITGETALMDVSYKQFLLEQQGKRKKRNFFWLFLLLLCVTTPVVYYFSFFEKKAVNKNSNVKLNTDVGEVDSISSSKKQENIVTVATPGNIIRKNEQPAAENTVRAVNPLKSDFKPASVQQADGKSPVHPLIDDTGKVKDASLPALISKTDKIKPQLIITDSALKRITKPSGDTFHIVW
jgi:hypothetical protein